MKRCLVLMLVLMSFGCHAFCTLGSRVWMIPVKGEVKYSYSFKKSTFWMALSKIKKLSRRIYMKTGKDSYGRIKYGDKYEIKVMPETVIRVDRMNIFINNGTSWFKVEKTANGKFVVETPTAIAGIRGTEFEIEVKNKGTTKLFVYTGEVEIRGIDSSRKVSIKPERMIRVRKGSILQRSSSFQSERRKEMRWSRKKWEKLQKYQLKGIEKSAGEPEKTGMIPQKKPFNGNKSLHKSDQQQHTQNPSRIHRNFMVNPGLDSGSKGKHPANKFHYSEPVGHHIKTPGVPGIKTPGVPDGFPDHQKKIINSNVPVQNGNYGKVNINQQIDNQQHSSFGPGHGSAGHGDSNYGGGQKNYNIKGNSSMNNNTPGSNAPGR